jgi:pyruvate,water dikinase
MENQGFDPLETSVSVVIQAMIPSEVAGVMFTANPVAATLEAVINASQAWGKRLYRVRLPDTITIRKRLRQNKQRAERPADRALGWGTLEVSKRSSRDPALSDINCKAGGNGSQIEAYYGSPGY